MNKLVPVEPTEAMLDAARMMAKRHDNGSEWITKFWQCMVAASPPSGGEPTAWLHTVRDAKARDGDTDLALSFDDHSFPLDSIGWVSIKAQPLYNSPRVVDGVVLSREHVKFIADILENYDDEGPAGEGWQSVELMEANSALQAALGEGK